MESCQRGVFSKDIILSLIAKIGTARAKGCVIEFAGTTISAMSVGGKNDVLCNMVCEAGARSGLIAPDD